MTARPRQPSREVELRPCSEQSAAFVKDNALQSVLDNRKDVQPKYVQPKYVQPKHGQLSTTAHPRRPRPPRCGPFSGQAWRVTGRGLAFSDAMTLRRGFVPDASATILRGLPLRAGEAASCICLSTCLLCLARSLTAFQFTISAGTSTGLG